MDRATRPLDPDQQEAVEHVDGPCLVLAGPGTGKTRVIVERFLRLGAHGTSFDHQLVLTYTRKAADEMRQRAEEAAGAFTGEPPLTTYHAFAFHVVRDWGWLAGVSTAFRVADAAERWLHVEAVLDELRPRALWNPLRPHELMDPLLSVITNAKQELVTPAQYEVWAARALETCTDETERFVLERQAEVAAVYARLDDRYRRHAVFDHEDCILYAELLIREQPVVRRAVAEPLRHVMVDEYQDTNFAQARFVETLCAGHSNLLVVADDDQSIYKFRGASRANLDRFARVYPGHRSITLTHNYRSTERIVDTARAVIAGAATDTRIAKQLVAERGSGTPVELWSAGDERSEMLAVAADCRDLIAAGTRPADIAWLFRQHVHMEPAMHALRELGVPYQVSGGRGFFQEREVKDVFALLAAAADPSDDQAVLRCLHLPAWRVSPAARAAQARVAREHELPLTNLIATDSGVLEAVPEADREAITRCADAILELHSRSQRDDVRDVFYEALELSEFLGVLDDERGAARLQIGANLNKLGELLESFADWSDDRRVGTALHYLTVLRDSRDASELPAIEPIEDGVVLLTAHGAKGLEWPVVFISRCTGAAWAGRSHGPFDLQLPDALVPEPAPPGDAAVDEERRLFYVAATRARDRLVCTWAQRYPRLWSVQAPVPFLDAATSAAERVVPSAPPAASRPSRAPGTPLPQRLSLAVSDLRVFKACPRRFEYRTIWRLPVRDSVQSWFGTLIHQVLHTAALQRAAGIDITGDVVTALWAEAWEQSRGPKGHSADLRALGEDQLRRYVASPAWLDATIDTVEDRVVLPTTAAEIVGRFDRVDRDGSCATVVDYKTSRPKKAEALRRDLQVRAYAVAMSQRAETDSVAVELHYLQTGEVARVECDSEFLRKAWGQLSATTEEIVRAWESSDFPPKPSSWQCPTCEYRTVCSEGREASGA
ncbi:MAG: ATP-dependent helicase [Candidatus Dormibacteraeota bacterium]|nr:ATP-dependent helicase [Candidatus Dormibacteraeota bacterium]